MKRLRHIHILFLFTVALTACQSDDLPVYQKGSNEYANQWIYEQMRKYYYWNDEMGNADLSLGTKEYFSQLLYHADRFSYVFHPAFPATTPQSVRRNFGFDLGFTLYEGQVYGVILYVLEGSPAKNYGLQRGQLITEINSSPLNQTNYKALYHSLEGMPGANLTVVEYDSETGFSEPQHISLTSYLTFSQPVATSIFTEGSFITGYISIPHFDIGQAQQFAQAFEEFKSAGCNEIIVDLRYNGGGDVSSAAALCTLLASNTEGNDFFIRFKGNENGGTIDQSFNEALQMNERTVSYEALEALRLDVSRVYILCGNQTASASEIVINNLRPYIDVVTIGERTVGKDMAGFAITDNRNPGEQGWILYPCIYKLFNANHQGNYSTGLEPVIQMNELAQLDIYTLGDRRELLTKIALDHISGNAGREQGSSIGIAQPLTMSYPISNASPIILPQNIDN